MSLPKSGRPYGCQNHSRKPQGQHSPLLSNTDYIFHLIIEIVAHILSLPNHIHNFLSFQSPLSNNLFILSLIFMHRLSIMLVETACLFNSFLAQMFSRKLGSHEDSVSALIILSYDPWLCKTRDHKVWNNYNTTRPKSTFRLKVTAISFRLRASGLYVG